MIHRLSRVYDDAGNLTHVMCAICMNFISVDDLYVDDNGDKHDVCIPCNTREQHIHNLIVALTPVLGDGDIGQDLAKAVIQTLYRNSVDTFGIFSGKPDS